MSEKVYWPDELVVGKRYRVHISDCCIEGGFTAVLVTKTEETVAFDNGVSLEIRGSQTSFEAEDE